MISAKIIVKSLVVFLAIQSISITAFGVEAPDDGSSFFPLFDATLARLQIARKVALSKWDNHQAIEDPIREKLVIANAGDDASAHGLARDSATLFFADQIEANKLVQYELLLQWTRIGSAPNEPRLNLRDEIRPRLDQLQADLIHQLIATTRSRQDGNCKNSLSRAAAQFATERHLDNLNSIAFDRAIVRICQP